VGATSGNVLLRTAQHKASIDDKVCAQIAKAIVAGKLQNCRVNILRAAREAKSAENEKSLREAAEQIGVQISTLPEAQTLEEIRGCEGQGSALYFSVFDTMITVQRTDFKFLTRNRRPPRDRVNALLSFIYALLLNDCISALEGVGLDPQIGYLHSLRSGRPALALDLMEEFRPAIAERLALTLINRRQLTADDFEIRPGESVLLNEKGRRTVVVAYQKRKQEEITHPLLKSKVPLGLVPHLQARLLARHIRGETSVYTPFIPR
jgi:CRISPR-associated protein Cas1